MDKFEFEKELTHIEKMWQSKGKRAKDIVVSLDRFKSMTEQEIFSLTAIDCTDEEVTYFIERTPQLDDIDLRIINLYDVDLLTYDDLSFEINRSRSQLFKRRKTLLLKVRFTIWRESHPGEKITDPATFRRIVSELSRQRRRTKQG